MVHISSLSPVSKVIIKLRGEAIKPATDGEFTVERMDQTPNGKSRQQQKHGENETIALFCYSHRALPFTDGRISKRQLTEINTACSCVYPQHIAHVNSRPELSACGPHIV